LVTAIGRRGRQLPPAMEYATVQSAGWEGRRPPRYSKDPIMRSRISWILIVLSLVLPVRAFSEDQTSVQAKSESKDDQPSAPAKAESKEDKTSTPDKSEAKKDQLSASGKVGPKGDKFHRLQAEMNGVLGELAGLQLKYRTADEEKQAEIQLQWKDLIAKGEKIEPKLIAAAEEAYAESPNDLAVAQLLVRLVQQWVEVDDYEPAARIGKLLMENNCPVKELANWVGLAAFAVGDLDAAEQYLGQAEKSGYYKAPPKEDKLAQRGEECLKSIPYYRKAWQMEQAIRADEAKADDLPRVLLKTSKGDIEIELYEDEAPNTVKNFISLVQKKFYDGLSFHRVIAGFMAQGGDPKGDGTGGPGYSIACECYQPNHRLHFRGVISMAIAGRDTGGSQFFINFAPTPNLDGKHTVFGRVISGMDVLAKIQRRNPEDKETRPDKIITATVVRKRDHAYVPQKMPE
jgi:cyclophilin family peptidyl-prolyl cis-trans isomerase